MDVLMPQLGETVAEGKITKWFKSAGDAVAPGDNLFEIETDKVSMEVPSTTTGVLAEIRVPAGEVAPVGAVVAVIGDGASAPADAPSQVKAAPVAGKISSHPTPSASAPTSAPAAGAPVKLDPFFEVRTPDRNYGPARLAGGTGVSPLARRLAAETGIDLGTIAPSGPHGRILARDVEAAARIAAKAPPPPAVAARAVAPAEGPSADEIKALYRDVPFEELPLDGMRRTIATRLVQAKQTIPHFYLTADVEIGRLLELREEANAAAPKDPAGNPAFKLSVNDLVIKAWAAALQRVPAANAVWAGDRILRFKHSDIGVAVAIEGGLIAPVHPPGGDQDAVGDLARDEGHGGTGARTEAHARRVPGRLLRHLQSRHVRRARILRHHQSAAGDHPRGGRRPPAGGRDRGRRRRLRERHVGDALLRSPRGRRRARSRAAGGIQRAGRATRDHAGVSMGVCRVASGMRSE